MEGNSALYSACANGFSKIVDSLVKSGADVNQRVDSSFTALMIAAAGGHLETVITLLELGADAHALNQDGLSALHLACWQTYS
jgi:ankyrin repeat protein